jgi:hypothetical protein
MRPCHLISKRCSRHLKVGENAWRALVLYTSPVPSSQHAFLDIRRYENDDAKTYNALTLPMAVKGNSSVNLVKARCALICIRLRNFRMSDSLM